MHNIDSEHSPTPVEGFASRLDAAVAQWRARLRAQILGKRVDRRPATDIAAAQTELREQLGAIDLQAAVIRRSLTRELSKALEAERQAMAWVVENDDGEARAAVAEHQRCMEAAATLDAELTLLKEMAVMCREALESIADRANATSDPVVPPSSEEL